MVGILQCHRAHDEPRNEEQEWQVDGAQQHAQEDGIGRKDECPGNDQPDFVAIPERRDMRYQSTGGFPCSGKGQQQADAQIKPVQKGKKKEGQAYEEIYARLV
jgi:hypothetical protein